MKRCLLMLSVLLTGIVTDSLAQFNKTYTFSGINTIAGTSIALLDNGAGGKDIVTCGLAMTSSSPLLNRCVLTKTDNNGNVLVSKIRDTTNQLERIIETIDNGVLLVSVFLDKIVVTKYDNNLNQLWSFKQLQNYDGNMAFGYSENVDIEKVYTPTDPPGDQENYYIVYTSGPGNSLYAGDANIGVMRIHQNGTLMWSKVYSDLNRSSYGSPANSSLRDLAHSITSFPSPANPNQKNLAICGTRDLYDPINIRQTSLFSFEIDNNGLMVTPYKKITTGDNQPFCPDILWDGTNLAVTYIERNSGAINPGPGNASGVGLLKFSPTYTGFTGRYYWSKCENYGLSLTQATDGNYIIGGWQSYCTGTFDASPMLFKVNKTSLAQIYCRQFNVKDNYGAAGFHRTDNAGFNYILGNNNFGNLRLIKTNSSGLTCGSVDNVMQVKTFTPSAQDLTYFVADNANYMMETIMDLPAGPATRDCSASGGDGSSYRIAKEETMISGAALSVYPTRIDNENEMITCKIPDHKDASVEIAAYNILGRKIYTNSYKLGDEGYIRFNSSVLEPGMNIIQIRSGNQNLQTVKVNVIR